LKQFFGLKIRKFFDADSDPGSGIFLIRDPDGKIRIRDPVSGINIPDPQHWNQCMKNLEKISEPTDSFLRVIISNELQWMVNVLYTVQCTYSGKVPSLLSIGRRRQEISTAPFSYWAGASRQSGT